MTQGQLAWRQNCEIHVTLPSQFRPQVTRIHRELPPGGVLVFVTGQREVEYLCKKLRTHFAAVAKRRQVGLVRPRRGQGAQAKGRKMVGQGGLGVKEASGGATETKEGLRLKIER